MRVYVMTDMEGASGAVFGGYGMGQSGEGDWSLQEMSREIDAAISGALDAGAEEVLVFEVGHHPFVPDEIRHPYARSTNIFDVRECDALMFVGQHGPAGVPDGVLSHCSCSRTVLSYRVNGHDVGEMGLLAGYAGHFGVPTVMVAGDRSAAREAADLLGDAEVAVVMEGLGNHSAVCLSPKAACRLVQEKAKVGVRRAGDILPMSMDPPLCVEYELAYGAMAASVARIPGVERINPRTVRHVSAHWLELHETFHAMVMAQQFWDAGGARPG